MKKLTVIFFLSFLLVSCNQQAEKGLTQTYLSDNSELEEAKAITRKLYEGLKEVEEKKITREAFEKFSEPLQQKLNTLILTMGDVEAKSLEAYKNELMVKMIQNEKDPNNL